MQKKLLSLIMMIGFGSICCNEIDNNLEQLLRSISSDDLEKHMGSLGESVSNIDETELRHQISAAKGQLKLLRRLLREKNISDFEKTNIKNFEKALVNEFSGQNDSIKTEFEKNEKENKSEEDSKKAKEWNGSLGYFWTSEPTKISHAGYEFDQLKSVRAKKDEINKRHHDLVTKNKSEVIKTLDNELTHQLYLLEHLYIKGLRVCGDDVDCLAKRKINWQDTQKEGFFEGFATEAYHVAMRAALLQGIEVSLDDMKKIAAKNEKTAPKIQKIFVAEKEAYQELNKILNPESSSSQNINLTDEGNKENKASIFEDPKEDQNDQGSLSE